MPGTGNDLVRDRDALLLLQFSSQPFDFNRRDHPIGITIDDQAR